MKTTYKYEIHADTIGDVKNLERHYSEMAEKGWMIDKADMFFYRYRAVEPCKKHFYVDYFQKKIDIDKPDIDETKDYLRICEDAGWELVTATLQLHVFCADGEKPVPVPIHTDNEIQAKIYLKACIATEFPLTWIPFYIFWVWLPPLKTIDTLLSNAELLFAIGFLLFCIATLWRFISVARWYIKTKKAAKNDLPMPGVNRRLAKIRNTFYMTAVLLMPPLILTGLALDAMNGIYVMRTLATFWMVAAILIFAFWMRNLMESKKRTYGGNMWFAVKVAFGAIAIIVGGIILIEKYTTQKNYADLIGNYPVLTLNDTGVEAETERPDTRVKSSLIIPVSYEYAETTEAGSVNTQVYHTVSTAISRWVYNRLSEEFSEQFDTVVLSPEEAAFWGAEQGLMFIGEDNGAIELLLLNEKTILRLSVTGENTDINHLNQAVLILY